VFTHKDIAGRTEPICVAGEVHTPERLLKALKPLDRVHPTPLFPERRTTYAGQPLAMVVAETLPQALDAIELVEVDYEELPAVTDPIAALEAEAPLVEPEFGSNLVLSVGITKGNSEEAFKRGDLVTVEEEFVTQRYVASPIETRGLQVMPDPVTGQLTVWSSTQTAHVLQMLMAVSLRMPAESIRVAGDDADATLGAASDRRACSRRRTCWLPSPRANSRGRYAGWRAAAKTSARLRTRATRSTASHWRPRAKVSLWRCATRR